ncbi:MAG: peptidoglycan bridge formation glycyltransferase FemA/FemB family protein [Patescibacteria group bacterium]|nr:peptidoglycan bridge formation glycyltransferase FemA/FemB family protein [Patescibacteria group bacterium]
MIKEISTKEEWEGFLIQSKEKTFLHSWNWGEFNKSIKKKIWRIGVYDKNDLFAVCLVLKINAKRGTYLLVEHGPIIKEKTENRKHEIMEEFLEHLKILSLKEKVSFIRICPVWKKNEENTKVFKDIGFRKAVMHERPEVSWVLPLKKIEEELLKEMRKTTRYLIRQALKNPDIEIIKSKDLKDVEIFNNIYQETVSRQNFSPFSLDYLKNEFLSFTDDDQIYILLGKYKDEIVSGAMIIFWQNSAFYHQGASLRKFSKIPVSYLLQWEAIKEAKNRGLEYYSFWGIAPETEDNHPWKGLTLFKKGFGGEKEEYVQTQDFVISRKYWLNYIVERFRKIKRGF